MSKLTQCTVLLLLVHYSAITSTKLLNVVNIPGNEICPTQEKRDEAIQNIRVTVKQNLNAPNCGFGEWYRVAYLSMSNSSQQCPSAWREYNTSEVRGCRRPETSSGSCPATFYPTSRQYSRVCGRVIGYQYGTTNAFGWEAAGHETIDSYYVYGVSVTHGAPRNQIWTLAAGISEGAFIAEGWDCPCVYPNNSNNSLPPSFVSNNYYCESGNPTDMYNFNLLYPTDPLWDGQQCEGECCTNGKSPPWFSVELPSPTTDDIEVRICTPENNQDDVVVQLLELYVQ